jgi:hypothetical protein
MEKITLSELIEEKIKGNYPPKKTDWRERYDEEFRPRNIGGSITVSRYLGLLKGQKSFIETLLTEQKKEILNKLPKERKNEWFGTTDYDIRCQEGVDFDEGYNKCLKELQALIYEV